MIKRITFASIAAILVAMMPAAAQAEDIKDLLTDADLAALCTAAGVGKQATGSVTLQGTVVSETFTCEAEDLIVGEDDNLSDDDSSDDDSSDDNSSDDDSSDDSSSDDSSSNAGGDDSEDD